MPKRNHEQTIQFIAQNNEHRIVFDPPVPAASMIPNWYKQMEANLYSRPDIGPAGNPSRTIKACMPVFDMLTAGYYILSPADIYFEKDNDEAPKASWSSDVQHMIDTHANIQFNKLTIPPGVYPTGLKFNNPWIIKTPPGYSTLFIQPSFRDYEPFHIIPGFVDTDRHPSPINFPFFLDKDFEGIIPVGTPIVQAIPIKRDNWVHSLSTHQNNEHEAEWQRAKRRIYNRYKTYFRTPKSWK